MKHESEDKSSPGPRTIRPGRELTAKQKESLKREWVDLSKGNGESSREINQKLAIITRKLAV